MKNLLQNLYAEYGIYYHRALQIAHLPENIITSPRRLPAWAKWVSVFLMPYRTSHTDHNISEYAIPRDYHLFAKLLEKELETAIHQKGICGNAAVFADTSPFAEIRLAHTAELGFVGKNGLIINPEYGSYVFVGGIVTDTSLDGLCGKTAANTSGCCNCNACIAACPGKILSDPEGICYSELSQKKKLTENEQKILAGHYLLWGCDICQQVCPHNKNVSETPIEFFRNHRLPCVTHEQLLAMSDGDFSLRAYAWRGKQVILRNALLIEAAGDSHPDK